MFKKFYDPLLFAVLKNTTNLIGEKSAGNKKGECGAGQSSFARPLRNPLFTA